MNDKEILEILFEFISKKDRFNLFQVNKLFSIIARNTWSPLDDNQEGLNRACELNHLESIKYIITNYEQLDINLNRQKAVKLAFKHEDIETLDFIFNEFPSVISHSKNYYLENVKTKKMFYYLIDKVNNESQTNEKFWLQMMRKRLILFCELYLDSYLTKDIKESIHSHYHNDCDKNCFKLILIEKLQMQSKYKMRNKITKQKIKLSDLEILKNYQKNRFGYKTKRLFESNMLEYQIIENKSYCNIL